MSWMLILKLIILISWALFWGSLALGAAIEGGVNKYFVMREVERERRLRPGDFR